MRYALAFGTNVNRDKMEVTVFEKKDRPLNNPTDSLAKAVNGNDNPAENAN